jgi:uncharacterized protein (TIGR03546 family)
MFQSLMKLIGSVMRPITTERSPHQLALAVALGVAIGLVPKLNLIALMWLLLLFVCRVNLLVGLLTACLVSLVGVLLDPYMHRLGDWLLGTEMLHPLFLNIYRLPLGPWTSINNTVVVGATVLGLLQFIPMYRYARSFFTHRSAQLSEHWLVKAFRTEASTGWRI